MTPKKRINNIVRRTKKANEFLVKENTMLWDDNSRMVKVWKRDQEIIKLKNRSIAMKDNTIKNLEDIQAIKDSIIEGNKRVIDLCSKYSKSKNVIISLLFVLAVVGLMP